MPNRLIFFLPILMFCSIIMACESEGKRKFRLEIEATEIESRRIEDERVEREKNVIKLKEEEEKRIQGELERKELENYNKFITNSLTTGATPYSSCFGRNGLCSDWGCSEIKVNTPRDSDVVVTIKKDGEVFRHAFIRCNSSYTFQIPNGIYQTFFYYGAGWDPEKDMDSQNCSDLKGGFISEVTFGKDSPQSLSNTVLSYELILQKDGNFSTQPSNSSEAF